MLGKFTRKHKTNSRLNLARRKGGLLVVRGELSGLTGDALEDVLDEGVHDAHSLLADAGVGMDLLEDLVDVGGVGFGTLLVALLLAVGGGLGRLGRSGLGGCFGHGRNNAKSCFEKERMKFLRLWRRVVPSIGWRGVVRQKVWSRPFFDSLGIPLVSGALAATGMILHDQNHVESSHNPT